jgi:hypothetical protein
MHPATVSFLTAAGGLFAHPRGGPVPWFVVLVPMGVMLLIVAAIIYVGYLREKRRTEALQGLAEELGFDFIPKDPELLAALGSFHLFTQGHGKAIKNVLRGEANGLETEVFDYDYTTGGGKSSTTWRQTVICFRLDGPELPAFSLRPENVLHRIGAWFGYQDINFEDFPVFSKSYLLQGPSETAIRDLFTERLLTYYEGRPGLNTEGGGNRLLFYRHGKRVDPEKFRAFLEEGFEVLAAFRPPDDGADARAE